MSFSLILSGNSLDFTTVFNSIVLQPPYEYEAALLSIDTYNSIPNIIIIMSFIRMKQSKANSRPKAKIILII